MKSLIVILILTLVFRTDSINQVHKIKRTYHQNSDDILFSCSFVPAISGDDCIPDNLSSFSTDNISIAVVLKKIFDALQKDSTFRITPNFLPYECEFSQPVFKALTKRNDSTRYILYTKKQLFELTRLNTNWVAYSIFAHEIAHHLYGHSLSNAKSLTISRLRELQADFFCGYVLHKLNSTLSQAQSGVNAFNNHPSSLLEEFCDHPTQDKRLNSIERGYFFSSEQGSTTKNLLNVDSMRNVKGVEEIFNKSLLAIINNDFQLALNTLKEIYPLLENANQSSYFNNLGFIKQQMGQSREAILDYNKAIELDNTQAEYFKNRGDAKIKLGVEQFKVEGKEDFKQAEMLEKFRF